MPRIDIVKRSPVSDSFRTAAVQGRFDIERRPQTEFKLSLDAPLDEHDWKLGLITGASGSGKSTVATNLWDNVTTQGIEPWAPTDAIVDGFDKNLGLDTIIGVLSSVGFSTVPAWLRPYGHLSTGQQFRADLARALARLNPDTPIVFDEFTSTIDRTVAKACSVAVSKTVRRSSGQFVAVTCHRDVLDWLQPDWVIDTDTNSFSWRSVQPRPEIQLSIESGPRSAWKLFHEHHYLTSDLSPSCRVFLVWATIDNETNLVGFFSILPSKGHKGQWRDHRVVVLPDYQGLGIGSAMYRAIGDALWDKERKRLRSVTSAPALNRHRTRHPDQWALKRAPSQVARAGTTARLKQTSTGRMTSSWLYIPAALRR